VCVCVCVGFVMCVCVVVLGVEENVGPKRDEVTDE
jgi:hypothetical protein